MAEKVTFNVLRRHEGDRLYEEGSTREAVAAEVAHLVAAGVLVQVDPANASKIDPLDHDRNGRKGGTVKAKG